MPRSMKRYAPYTACIAGIITILLLLPRFNPAQPRGIRLTRGEAVAVADAAARKLGIPVDQSWPTLGWNTAGKLNQELRGDPQRRARAWDDPVIGPRLGSYRRIYYWRGKDKNTPHGLVDVDGRTGQVLDARVTPRDEETGKHATEAELRPRADAFVRSRNFDGAPSPQFESARPTVMRTRTDWVFRYRVPTSFRIGDIVPYLNVYFAGEVDVQIRHDVADAERCRHAVAEDPVGARAHDRRPRRLELRRRRAVEVARPDERVGARP